MTNHNPTFTSSAATGGFSENANTTGSTALHTLSGTMGFSDSDHGDTHTASATLASASWSGGSSIPASSLADLNAALSASILSDNNGTGSLKWTFNAADDDFDFLAKNETLVLTYNVKVSDNHGGFATQTVKITVTGTDDKPIIDTGVHATVTEQANQTLSLSPDTTHVALHFTDPDLNNTGQTATVTAVSASGATAGLLPDGLGTAELLAFYHIDNVQKSAGSSSGTINTTFSAPDLAFDYLAAGQTLNLTYTVQIDDHAGGVTTQTVVITVVGTNDKPAFLSGPATSHLTEGQNLSSGNLTAQGDLLFGDIDLADTHTVSTTVTAIRSSGGAVPLSNAALLAAMHTTLDDSTGTLLGDVDWNFALSNSSVNFLSGGETLTLTYNITVADPSHATTTQTVTVTILGTNHPVAITSGPEAASLSELAGTTGSATVDITTPVPTGTLAFTDADLSDTHTVAVSVGSVVWSGGSSVPAATQTALASALATTLHDSTGSGSGGVDWSFAIPDNKLDFLGASDTLTVTYNVKVSDATTSSTQTVTVTVHGANDPVTITSAPESASVAELANTTGSSTLDTTSPVPTGTLAFTDVDLSDTHSVSVALGSAVWSFNPDFVPFQTLADLQTALATTLHDSTGSGSGGINWTFAIPDKDLDFLAAGETLTANYIVTVSDGTTSSSQTVTITATGAADTAIVVHPVTTTVADTALIDDGQVVAVGNLITDAGDTAGDLENTLSVTNVNGQSVPGFVEVDGTYGALLVFSDGTYLYIANSALDALQLGDHPTEQFNFTVSDSNGHNVPTTLTININGADDAPVATGGTLLGSVTEDAGPQLVINGGFETGDFTGWDSTGTVQFLGAGGAFGNYAAAFHDSGMEQDIATTPGQHYTLSFYVAGDPESFSNDFTAYWDGTPILALTNFAGGFTQYTFDVVGDASSPTTSLIFISNTDGNELYLDQVSLQTPTGPATESTAGSVSFSDVETGDTHTASFTPDGSGYVGMFSVDPVSESGGSGTIGWHFTVNNADIQYLAQGQSVTQSYTVAITDSHGATGFQDVSVTLIGTNDAPTAVNDTVITDVGANGTVDIPAWALAANDTDPDLIDVLTPSAIVSSTGGTAVPFVDVFFIDDATPGGSFTYTVTDGHVTSTNAATATIVNGPTSTTALTGTSGADILIATNGTESLSGGGGNDVLIANNGSHVMTGGAGDDIFGFVSVPNGTDTITDFNNTTQADKIAVSASAFGGGLAPHEDLTFDFETTNDNQFSGFVQFHFDTANQTLYYSPDYTQASAVAVVQVQVGVTLHPNDLLVV